MKSKISIYVFSVLLLCITPYYIYANQLSLQLDNNFYSQPKIQWSFTKITPFNIPLQLKTAYSTSRLEARTKNALKIDHISLSAAYEINPIDCTLPFTTVTTSWTSFIQNSIGYKQYEIEDPVFSFLDNTSLTYTLSLGTQVTLKDLPYGLDAQIGYNLIQTGFINPISISIGVWLDV